ncbi:XrtA/PEP-CTERM system amidotransferase [Emcibacter sp. SYSU 3D8]|uniref:XrtA/PEP-CTERM system amidotransferase n=1 Tax=Emcibacter sp. SYSU 3D8 TaxID=3133969 RepID=UPI0031FE620C
MCGLAGMFDGTGTRPMDRGLLRRMTDTLVHRGPDGSGLFAEPGIALGHRRLSIIDLAGGAQPMTDPETGVTVVFNGEIYNFPALMDTLAGHGHRFRTRCDTEVILHGWKQWGAECLSHLDGMFAFALWDPRESTLFLARDRLGKKPLYYAILPGGLCLFGSELKALACHPDLPRDIDTEAVADFFAYGYVPDPKSIYRAARKLAPGHCLRWRRGGEPQLRQWWDLQLAPTAGDPADVAAQLEIATRRRLIADVPLGAFLSGGVDSSAIVAQMALGMETPVKTFSIGFGDRAYDESAYAGVIASRYGTDHTARQVDPDSFGLIDRLAGIYDEPFGDSSAIPTFQVCALAREKVSVALSGDGGDEVFGGYRRYLWHEREARVRRLLSPGFRRVLFGTLGKIYPRADWAPRMLRARTTFQELALDDVDAYFLSVSATTERQRRNLLSLDVRGQLHRSDYHPIEVLRDHWRKADGADPLKQAQYADIKTWLPGDILVKVDRASMANSLEVRAPFLDHRLLEWGVNLPASVKIAGGEKKAILKQAMDPFVPADILYRPKQGFSVPIGPWFRGPLRDMVREALTGSLLSESGFVDAQAVEMLLNQHQGGYRDNSRILWLLLMFQGFLRHDAASRP